MNLDKEDIKWEKKKRRTTIITSMERAAAAVMSIAMKNMNIMPTTMNTGKAAAAVMNIIMKNTSIITAMLQIIYREKFIL